MAISVSKNKTYIEQYKYFLQNKKTFTVKFYREYEGDGGYWDYRDVWISGETVQEIIIEKTFDNLESALMFADTMQATLLEEVKEKYVKSFKSNTKKEADDNVYWMSSFTFSFLSTNNHDLISAHINWGGSDYNMDITYNIIEK